jgi:hypothetical protein
MAIDYTWRYSTLKEISLCDEEFIRSVIKQDAKKFSKDSKAFIQRNYEQYELAINLWGLMVGDIIGQNTKQYILYYLKESGLCDTIRHTNTVANYIVSYSVGKVNAPLNIIVEFATISSALMSDGCRWDDKSRLKDILQCLRFLKRFTPWGMDKLEKEKIEGFLSVNFELDRRDEGYTHWFYVGSEDKPLRYRRSSNIPYTGDEWKSRALKSLNTWGVLGKHIDGKTKVMTTGTTSDPLKGSSQPRRISRTIIRDLKAIIADMLKGYKYDESYDSYSNGASIDTCKCTYCKRLSKHLRDTASPFVRIDYKSSHMTMKEWAEAMANGERVRPLDSYGHTFYASRLALVPKDYKGPRIIAPEAQDKQEKMKGIAKALELALAKNGYMDAIPLHDQTVNQKLAALGAATGLTATVDSSHASDSNMKELVYQIFPQKIVDDFIRVMPTHINIQGKIYRLNMFGTMGSALTFIVEAIVFYAIARLALEYTLLYGVRKGRSRFAKLLRLLAIYGDDIVIPTIAYGTCLDLLRICGFEPNDDKSYGTGTYRESCGKEYIRTADGDVEELSSIYWPRRDMSNERVVVNGREAEESFDASLLALANRIYALESRKTEVCHCHNYIRLWLVERYKVVFVPEVLAYPGMLIGDDFTLRVKSLLTGERLTIEPSELATHPEYRVLATTATRVERLEAPNVSGCIHNQLTTEQANDVYDYILYQEFLQYGPYYEDPLMELLACSSRRSLGACEDTLQRVCHFDTRYML